MSANKKQTAKDVAGASPVPTSIDVSGGKSPAPKVSHQKDISPQDFGYLEWVHCCHGSIPEFPVSGRDDKHAPDMFVGRTKHNGELIPGGVIPRDGCIYVAGCEYKYKEYEVLANPEHYTLTWVHSRGGDIHPRAIPGGYDRSGGAYFIGRHMHNGHFALGKVRPADHRRCYLFEGKDYDYDEFEVLVCSGEVMKSDDRSLKGKCQLSSCNPGQRSLGWIPGSHGSIPGFAVYGRDDNDAPDMIVGRTWHDGELIVGKVMPRDGCIYVALGGSDNRHEQYEVLTNPERYKLIWVHTKKGVIDRRAVPGGYDRAGTSYYIGRHMHNGHMVLGKVQPTYHNCWIPYEGTEYLYLEYEVLVCQD